MFDVAVIGGGASGLTAAIHSKNLGASVCVIEINNKLGKKILATGNGRCNLSNSNINETFYNTMHVKEVFDAFGLANTLAFFSSIGIETFADAENRIYPLSESAKDVVDALTLKLQSQSVKVFYDTGATKIEKTANAYTIHTSSTPPIMAKTVVIATGARTAKMLLNSFHSFKNEMPVLVGYECEGKYFKNLAGIRINAKLSLQTNGIKFEEVGQVQMRENGISGIVVFDASAVIAKHGNLPVKAELQFLPSASNISTLLSNKQINSPHITVENLLLGLLPKSLAGVILEMCNINAKKHQSISCLTEKELQMVEHTIQHFPIKMLSPFGEAQVLAGGVDLNSLNNLESTTLKNVFLCGEAVHVFGKSGGYNLQWAWSSGVIAGMQAGKRSKELEPFSTQRN